MGLIGGGAGSFIGKVHHMAALLDNRIELVCGALSHDPERSKQSGKDYLLPDDRVHIGTETGLVFRGYGKNRAFFSPAAILHIQV